ncbi:MAG: glycosyltransferase [Pirellulales bacterium]
MAHPWLSVIMPTCNGGRYLRQAFDSIVAQGPQSTEIEVIVVDDGSSDGTLAIAADYQRLVRLTIERRAHCGNWVANTNHGIRLARGRYISILHQDDMWSPARLRALKRLTARHPGAGIYVHPCWYASSAGRRIGYWHCPFAKRDVPLGPSEVLPRLLVQCCYGIPAPMFDAAAARAVGLMDESLWFSADWDFWLKLSRTATTIYCATPLAMFRLHSASQTVTRARSTDEIHQQQLAVLERHRSALGTAIEPAVWRVARFSANMNAALLRLLDGRPNDVSGFACEFCTLGPRGWSRYFRDSRIVERCLRRLQAGAVGWRAHADSRLMARALARAARPWRHSCTAILDDRIPVVPVR